MRISFKAAQASIEYMTITALVVTGIVIMTPHVIRSINAHFHALDDQVQDSMQEKIDQSSQSPNLPSCGCGDWKSAPVCGSMSNPGNCSDGDPSTPCCGDFERYYYKVCTPAGCNKNFPVGPIEKCASDLTCCMPWANNKCAPPGMTDDYGNSCNQKMIQTRTCAPGSSEPLIQCVTHPDCSFKCLPPKAEHTELCPGDDVGLTADTPYTLVSSCTPGVKCEVVCDPSHTFVEEIIKAIVHVCDDDAYNPLVDTFGPTPGHACSKPKDNGGVVCSVEGTQLGSGDTSEKCPNLESYQVPVKKDDLIQFYKLGDNPKGSVTFHSGCGGPDQTINDDNETITAPCDGYITNYAKDDNIGTTVTRLHLASCACKPVAPDYPGCNTPSVIVGNSVWASCNVGASTPTDNGTVGGSCPSGWHKATSAEWDDLRASGSSWCLSPVLFPSTVVYPYNPPTNNRWVARRNANCSGVLTSAGAVCSFFGAGSCAFSNSTRCVSDVSPQDCEDQE
jgi:hypothetical protein